MSPNKPPIGKESKGEYNRKEVLNKAIYLVKITHLYRCQIKAVVDYCRCDKEQCNNKREQLDRPPDPILPALRYIFGHKPHGTKLVNFSYHHKIGIFISATQVVV